MKTYKFEKIPVEDIIIHVSLTMKQVAKKLSQVRVVRLIIKP